MVSQTIYAAVATLGIAAAAGGAYWFQSQPTGPKEISTSGAPSGGVPGATVGGAPGGARGGGMPSVEVAKVETARLQDDAQSVGTLRSKQNVMLRPEVSGRVQSLGFTDGGRVRRGEVLMQLEDTLQRAEVRQAEAQVSIARANLKRNQDLVAQNFVAQRVVDEAAAQMQVVEAQMALACARWERMRVVAPFDGTVGIRNVNVGDYVKDGADLVNLEDLSSIFVDFRMPERFLGKLRREQVVEMQLDAMPGRQFKAKIEAIDPQVEANGRSVLVRATLPNTNGEPLAQQQRGGPGGASGAAGASVGSKWAGRQWSSGSSGSHNTSTRRSPRATSCRKAHCGCERRSKCASCHATNRHCGQRLRTVHACWHGCCAKWWGGGGCRRGGWCAWRRGHYPKRCPRIAPNFKPSCGASRWIRWWRRCGWCSAPAPGDVCARDGGVQRERSCTHRA
ncbi:MAG: efflux RND transporter periplasmic adaptor subunit [Brachymonas sp.]|nr:efflux RND transporter periplasmic adaptor subunit [Brachymonas sp.]